MKVLLSWLQEFAPGIDGEPDQLAATLSGLGLAVEETVTIGGDLDGIVVGKVLDLSPHPAADRIQLVSVDAGTGEPLQVCCGAFNMAVGDLIPFATIGTVMPNGMEIQQRKMRGELSNGMCCAASEIGIGADDEGIMILNDLADAEKLGAPIADALGVERDVLFDLEVNANRPDAMSVAGVARDLAAALGVPFSFPERTFDTVGESAPDQARVEIVDPTLCGRFLARVIHDVKIGTSPQWMQRRLTALGMRPINSIVDVSNYVMLELGQPNHTYDLDKVANGVLGTRRARRGEQISTLDGIERTLTEQDGVVVNGADEAVGIAGVMGGATTEISESTTSILVEMAWWDPPSISRSVKRLNLTSEASTRNRRGADWGDNMDRALDRFCQLMSDDGASVAPGQIDERGDLPSTSTVSVRPVKVNSLLGTDLTSDEMAAHLTSIGFGVEADASDLSVTIPTWRWDVANEVGGAADAAIAEEVGRMYGYDNIARTVPTGGEAGRLTQYQHDRRLVREVLLGAGCDETQPMPFLAPGDLAAAGLSEDGVKLSNPLDASESVLRTSLLPGQLKSIAYNDSHRNSHVRFFEIGTVFLPPVEGQLLPDEREFLGVALSGPEAPEAVGILNLLTESLALPNVILRNNDELPGMHPTRSAEVVVAGQTRGVVGEIAPSVLAAFDVSDRVAWLQLDLGAVLNGPHGKRKYKRVSKFPSSDMDLAFVVADDIAADKVVNTIRKSAGALLVELRLLDVYRGDSVPAGSRSLAYRLRFQATDHTLSDDEITGARGVVVAAVLKQTDGVLRV